MQPTRIDWLNQFDFDSALQQSGRVSKPVLVDFHDPTCAGCQQLERVTYSDPSVISAIIKQVIPLRVVTAEPDSASTAIITRYISISSPTVQLLSPMGTVYHCWRGAPRHTRPAHGYRGVYHEAAGHLSPVCFLAQLLIGRGKMALKHERYAEATQLFEEVLTEYPADDVATTEARYWWSIASSKSTTSPAALRRM